MRNRRKFVQSQSRRCKWRREHVCISRCVLVPLWNNDIMFTAESWCTECAKKGRKSKIRLYQINLDEAIYMCENGECIYPLDKASQLNAIVENNFWKTQSSSKRRKLAGVLQKMTATVVPGVATRTGGSTAECHKGLAKKAMPVEHFNSKASKLIAPTNSVLLTSLPNVAASAKPLINLPKSMDSIVKNVLSENKQLFSENLCAPYIMQKRCLDSVAEIVNSDAMNECASEAKKCKVMKETGVPETVKTLPVKAVIQSKKTVNEVKPKELDVPLPEPTDVVQNTLLSPSTGTKSATPNSLLQWQNKEALCWLDVVLCLLVHNKTLKYFIDSLPNSHQSVVKTLLIAYEQALSLHQGKKPDGGLSKPEMSQKQLRRGQKSNKDNKNSETGRLYCGTLMASRESSETLAPICTGAGIQVVTNCVRRGQEVISDAMEVLHNVREKVWKLIQPKLKCKKGKNDSPVLAMSIIVQDDDKLRQLFTMDYTIEFTCEKCFHRSSTRYSKVMPTFAEVGEKFSVPNASLIQICPECSQQRQHGRLQPHRLGDILLMHFVKGLSHNDFNLLDFTMKEKHYVITGLVQYKNNPDHFVAWIRNPESNLWMECDDLKSPQCYFLKTIPNIPCSEIHIIQWEHKHYRVSSKIQPIVLSFKTPATAASVQAVTVASSLIIGQNAQHQNQAALGNVTAAPKYILATGEALSLKNSSEARMLCSNATSPFFVPVCGAAAQSVQGVALCSNASSTFFVPVCGAASLSVNLNGFNRNINAEGKDTILSQQISNSSQTAKMKANLSLLHRR